MNNLKLILGGPGCGKTTRLLSIMEEELADGVPASQIAFMAFTRAAATEAASRAATKFNLRPEEDLPWFRTLHSAAYKTMGLNRDEVMEKGDWRAFGKMVGEPVSGSYDPDEIAITGLKGDQMLRVVDYAATTLVGLRQAWEELETPVDWWEVERFANTLLAYKNETGKMDYTDMITVAPGHVSPLSVRVAILDEAQDLTPAQWALARHLFGNAERTYAGGDDDQAIYKWAGADVGQFLGLHPERGQEVLPVSHRLPKTVHRLVQQLSRRIQHRYPKVFGPSAREGAVRRYRDLSHVDLQSGTWLLLARNGYMLKDLVELAEAAGVSYRTRHDTAVNRDHVKAINLWNAVRAGTIHELTAAEVRALVPLCGMAIKDPKAMRETARYTVERLSRRMDFQKPWHEAFIGIPSGRMEYYMSAARRGEDLTGEPRVRIDTIHGVKGAEADHVLLMTDISRRTAMGLEREPDHEHRVFYVGASRARQTLHIISPQSRDAYPI